MLALLGWQLGHGTALQPWPSTLLPEINLHQTSQLKAPMVLNLTL